MRNQALSTRHRNTGRKRTDRYRITSSAGGGILVVVVLAFAGLFYPSGSPAGWIVDILFRSYLMFLGCVMAHEAVDGPLGPNKDQNYFWGRFALLPSMVPFTNFWKTHRLHHGYTNVPGRDPDLFMKPRHPLEIPFRAVAMPH